MSKHNLEPSANGPCCSGIGELLQARFFKALCDPNRIAILVRLAQRSGPATVSEAAACCPTCVSVVSRHLAILREAGILESQKRGREVYYTVRFAALAATLRSMADAIEGCCASPGSSEK